MKGRLGDGRNTATLFPNTHTHTRKHTPHMRNHAHTHHTYAHTHTCAHMQHIHTQTMHTHNPLRQTHPSHTTHMPHVHTHLTNSPHTHTHIQTPHTLTCIPPMWHPLSSLAPSTWTSPAVLPSSPSAAVPEPLPCVPGTWLSEVPTFPVRSVSSHTFPVQLQPEILKDCIFPIIQFQQLSNSPCCFSFDLGNF